MGWWGSFSDVVGCVLHGVGRGALRSAGPLNGTGGVREGGTVGSLSLVLDDQDGYVTGTAGVLLGSCIGGSSTGPSRIHVAIWSTDE